MKNKTNEKLKSILNTEEFGTDRWNEASDELHARRVKDIEENPLPVDPNWCTSDGQWWN